MGGKRMMHLSLWGPLLIADTIGALLIVGAGVILGIQLHANARKTRIFRGVAALAVGVALYLATDHFPGLILNPIFPLSEIFAIITFGACGVAGIYLLVRGTRGKRAIL
jgi:hypothetical protein